MSKPTVVFRVAAVLAGVVMALRGWPVGFGAYPLSESLTAMWLDVPAEGGHKPVVLVYFHGAAGWHHRKWERSLKGNLKEPGESVQDLVSGDLVLSLHVSADLQTATVQGKAFSLSENNVFLVRNADKGQDASQVDPLGVFDLSALKGDTIAGSALQKYPQLTKSLMVLTSEEPPSAGGPFRIHDLVRGSWGWTVEGLTCKENPHTFVFSEDLTKATLRYSKGVDGQPPLEVVYTVVGEGRGYLRMRKEGETETAKDGSPVLWDWVLLSGDKYCWHRTDWREGGCTKPIVRCPSDGKLK